MGDRRGGALGCVALSVPLTRLPFRVGVLTSGCPRGEERNEHPPSILRSQ
jgi:hypothetical protein